MGDDPNDLIAASDADGVTEFLAFDTKNPASITSSLNAAWENARGAREAISAEMWESLNTTHHMLPAQGRMIAGRTPHDFFRWVKERAAMLAGLADSTLTRDEGWSFLVLGRNLERVDMTARLLSARYAETWGPTVWTTTLRCCLRLRGVPAHLPARCRRVVRARVPAPRSAVPTLGPPRAHHRPACARRARPPGEPDGRRRRGASRPRAVARGAELPARERCRRRPARAARQPAGGDGRGPQRGHEPVLPRHPRHRLERLMRDHS